MSHKNVSQGWYKACVLVFSFLLSYKNNQLEKRCHVELSCLASICSVWPGWYLLRDFTGITNTGKISLQAVSL